jgi:hypothetical protein
MEAETMPEEACPLPSEPESSEQGSIHRMLGAKRIAVVGLSDDPQRPSYEVGAYLKEHGYDIVPVNPRVREVLGRPAAKSLAELDGPVDVVLVFRSSEACEEVTWEALKAGAKGVWLQSGIRNEEAKKLAEGAGIDFVQDRCMMVTHMHEVDRTAHAQGD